MPETWEKCCIKHQSEKWYIKYVSHSCGNMQHLTWDWYLSQVSQTDKPHSTSPLSLYLFPDQETRPPSVWVSPAPLSGLLSTGAFTLAEALKNILLHVLVRAKGHINSFWAVGLGCCQWRQTLRLCKCFLKCLLVLHCWNIIILMVWTGINVHFFTKGKAASDLNAFSNVSSFLFIKVEPGANFWNLPGSLYLVPFQCL